MINMFIDKTLQIFSAYGRKYKTIKSFKEDWSDEKDFYSERGYLSKRDINNLLKKYDIVYYKHNNKVIYIIRFNKIESWVK